MNWIETPSLSWNLLSLLEGILIRSTILAGVCALLALTLRSRTAALEHFLWKSVLYGLFLLPVLQILMPPLRPASRVLTRMESVVLPATSSPRVTIYHPARGITIRTAVKSVGPASAAQYSTWPVVFALLYLAVTCLLFVRLAFSLARVGRIVANSEFVNDARLHELAHETWLLCGAGLKPRIRVSREVAVPLAVEFDDLWILLPDSWRDWDSHKLHAVLMHEMAHIARNDPATALWASVASCLLWFHPLGWFLKRHLAALAEQACDEAALESASSPEEYGRVLIDFSREVTAAGGRMLVAASAIVRCTQIEKRIRRIFSVTRHSCRSVNAIRTGLIAIFAPLLCLTAAARFVTPQAGPALPSPQLGLAGLTIGWDLTPDQVNQLESDLQTDPENLRARALLTSYYLKQTDASNYKSQLFWVIEHHPEAQMLDWAMVLPPAGGALNSAADYVFATELWQHSLADHPKSAPVLYHAALFFEHSDAVRALNLLKQARELESSNDTYLRAEARIYQAAFDNRLQEGDSVHQPTSFPLSPEAAQALRTEIENSTDAALLSEVGKNLAVLGTICSKDADTQSGLHLLERAIALDPNNPQWKEDLDWAKAEPTRMQNWMQVAYAAAPPTGAVRIGAQVAEASLLKKVEPEYPPLALSTRIQGTVEFAVTIGPDGHVKELKLVRGHPLLVNAAKDAVLKWTYKPTLLNGNPVSVVTDVLVPFTLPQ